MAFVDIIVLSLNAFVEAVVFRQNFATIWPIA